MTPAPATTGSRSRASPLTPLPLRLRRRISPSSTSRWSRGDRSEIQVGVVLGRLHAGDVVGEDGTEARPRLDPRIPVLGAAVLGPGQDRKSTRLNSSH